MEISGEIRMPKIDDQQKLQSAVSLHQKGNLNEAAKLYRALITTNPNNYHALHYLGVIEAGAGNIELAKRLMARSLSIQPPNVQFIENYATLLFQVGDYESALKVCRQGLQLNNPNSSLLYVSAVSLFKLSKFQESIVQFDQLLLLQPNHVAALNERGSTLAEMERYDDALASIEKALALQQQYADAHLNKGNVCGALKRYDEAIAAFDRALALNPGLFSAWLGRGNVLRELKRHEEALGAYDKALSLKPDLADAWLGRGNVFFDLKRYNEALDAYDKALALKPGLAEAWLGRGNVFREPKRYDDALGAYNRALSLKPDLANAWLGRGNVFFDLKRYDEALGIYNKALALKPGLAEAWLGRGNVFIDLKRYDEALGAYDKALSLKPDLIGLEGLYLHTKMLLCDWKTFDVECAHLISTIRNGKVNTQPFVLLGIPSSSEDQLKCAKNYCEHMIPRPLPPLCSGKTWRHDKIRIAYLSADFREHAVSYLVAGILEHHDQGRFETTAISWGPDDNSEMRARIKQSTEFINVRGDADAKIAELIRDKEIDIAVDLMGFTQESRTAILARRPAPIQVGFLGYPGTSATDFMDYIIGDPIVLPFDRQPYYTENIVHLPDCFMPTDSRQSVAREVPSRGDVGLPEKAFVFCSFSESYKINPFIFDIWMRLLRDVAGSVLWLQHTNDTAITNLRHEAKARGIAGDRLIFAPRLARAEHLARISLGDLFLNTHPVNAGANAIDALSVGLPIVTTLGDAFVERVTASLLHAVGLPDLVVGSIAEYEALALQLARDPAKLAEIKAKLANNRDSYTLFNTERFTRHIESAYTTMWETWQRGETPHSFGVEPIERYRPEKAP